jgi:hypothetical protein
MSPMMAATALILVLGCSIASVSAASYNTTCQKIASAISPASDVYYPGSPQYLADVSHYMTSSAQNASCSVEPGTAADVGVIVRYISICSMEVIIVVNCLRSSSESLIQLGPHSQ